VSSAEAEHGNLGERRSISTPQTTRVLLVGPSGVKIKNRRDFVYQLGPRDVSISMAISALQQHSCFANSIPYTPGSITSSKTDKI
jgi:hypothetical protein